MISRWFRAGIRTQITIMVLIGAVLTTGVTLLIADASIQGYGIQQAQEQATRNLNVALLELRKQFGPSVSISSDGYLVLDSPNSNQSASGPSTTAGDQYGKFLIQTNQAYVDAVQALLSSTPISTDTAVQISVYQCVNGQNVAKFAINRDLCPRVSTTLFSNDNTGAREVDGTVDNSTRAEPLSPQVVSLLNMHTNANGQGMQVSAVTKTIQETIDGISYLSIYNVLSDPDGHVIGVLGVSQPLTTINALLNRTTLELIISGIVIMLAGIILALLVASAISGTLQRASRQLGTASSQLNGIADTQAAGSRQQVWAINAINQALQNLQETSNDVSQRTDQLAQIGTQVAMRRAEIAPAQFESIMAYMTRSAGDISVASRHQTTTIDRMASAMEAVVEIADQVAGSSQQTTESARRLDVVIGQLEQLVTGHESRRRTLNREPPPMAPNSGQMAGGNRDRGMPNGQMQGGPMPMRDMGVPMSNSASRPRPGPMPMGAPGARPMGANQPPQPPYPGYTASARGTPGNDPAMGRPMLPSGDRGQPRPRPREQSGWDRGQGDQSSGNYPNGNGYGGGPSWPNADQGRNAR